MSELVEATSASPVDLVSSGVVEQWIDVEQAARLLSVSTAAVYDRAARHEIGGERRVGRRVFFEAVAFGEYQRSVAVPLREPSPVEKWGLQRPRRRSA